MRRLRAWLARLAGSFHRRRRETDLAAEFESHLQLHVDELIRAGVAPAEARRRAFLALGGLEAAKEAVRDRQRFGWLEQASQDLRYGLRGLGRHAGFTATAVLTLAVGIGAGTTISSVATAVFLPSLPYRHPERLVAITEADRLADRSAPPAGGTVASADLVDWQRMSTAFSAMAGYEGLDEQGRSHVDLFLTSTASPVRLKGLYVFGDLFRVLGVSPAIGRDWSEAEFHDRQEHGVILSDGCWRADFGGDPAVIGTSVTLSGVSRPVIGVMPAEFFFPNTNVDVYLASSTLIPNRDWHDMGVVARLAPGVTLRQAQSETSLIGDRLGQAYPATNGTLSVRVQSWHSSLAASSRPALVLLVAAVGMLFAIVCSNVAHLQLSRGASRLRELGVRRALGATRGRLIRQLLTESLALSVILTVCASLLIHSFLRLERVDLGFQPERSVAFRVDVDQFVPRGARASGYLEIEDALLHQPDIEAAGGTNRPVLGGGAGGEADVTILGRTHPLRLEIVTPGYLQAMRTPLLRGRLPGRTDASAAPLIAVVNSAFERTYFPDRNTVHQRIGLGRRGPAEIVGVVADVKQEAVDQPTRPAAFLLANQIVPSGGMTFVVRGSGDRAALVASAGRAVRAVNRAVPLSDIATLDDLVQASLSTRRIRTWLLSLLAGAALSLAALGVYGVLAYSVVQRVTELGIRMALGATASSLFGMIVLEGLRPVLAGIVFGIAGAWIAGGMMRSLLFGVTPADPSAYIAALLVLTAASICACALPARRAIQVDPAASLRQS